MVTPKTKKSLEAIFIGVQFAFDQQSKELTRMRRLLLSGIAVALTPTDIPDGSGGRSRPEVVASFFVVNGLEYLRELQAAHGEYVSKIFGESVLQLGAPCPGASRVMDALLAGCTVYLIPEEGDGVLGRYTLCVVDS